MQTSPKYRYPGINSFTDEDEDIFCGRTEDARKLLDRLMLNHTLVLHGDSGKGKSSLVQAGLLPQLRKYNKQLAERGKYTYLPITIKLDQVGKSDTATSDILVAYTLNAIHKSFGSQMAEELDFLGPHPHSFWYTAKLLEKNKYSLLLIFDQFEELQGFSAKQTEAFAAALSDLFVATMPEKLYEEYDANTRAFASQGTMDTAQRAEYSKAIGFLEQPLSSKVVFVVREDKLGTMSLLSDYFPDILKNDFYLHPLNEQNARRAITEPAQKEGNYIVLPFTIEPAAVQKLVDGLVDKDTELYDPIQLQIACSNIEKKIAIHQSVITADQLPAIDDFIRDFYLECWDDIRKKYAWEEGAFLRLKKNMITELVVQGKRNLAHEGLFTEPEQRSTIADLVRIGLLREVRTGGDKFYQLCHDRFIEPMRNDEVNIKAIEEANEHAEREKQLLIEQQQKEMERTEKEKQILIQLQQQKEQEAAFKYQQLQTLNAEKEAARLRKSRRTQRWLAIIIFIVVVLVLGSFIFLSYNNTKRANTDKFIAMMTALKRTGNPLLSYIVGKEWSDANPMHLESLDTMLMTDGNITGVYLTTILPSNTYDSKAFFSNADKDLVVTNADRYNPVPITTTWDVKESVVTAHQSGRSNCNAVVYYGKIFYLQMDDSLTLWSNQYKKLFQLNNTDSKTRISYLENSSMSPNGKYLCVNSTVFSISDNAIVGELAIADSYSTTMKPAGKILWIDDTHLAGVVDDSIQIFSLSKVGKKLSVKVEPEGNYKTPYNITNLAVDKKGKRLFAALSNNQIQVIAIDSSLSDKNTGTTRNKYASDKGPKNHRNYLIGTLQGHGGQIQCLAVSNKGNLLLSGSEDNTAILWDISHLKALATLAQAKSTVLEVGFSPDDTRMFTKTQDFFYLWRRGKLSDLYASNDLYRYSPFEYNIWGIDSKTKKQISNPDDITSLYKRTLAYLVSIKSNQKFLDDSDSDSSKLAEAKKEIKQMVKLLTTKKKEVDAVGYTVLIARYKDLVEPPIPDVDQKDMPDLIRNYKVLYNYYQDEGKLLIDTNAIDHLFRTVTMSNIVAWYYMDSLRSYDKPYRDIQFFDTIVKGIYTGPATKNTEGVSEYIAEMKLFLNISHFKHKLYTGDFTAAEKPFTVVSNNKDILKFCKNWVVMQKILVLLAKNNYTEASNLYSKNIDDPEKTTSIFAFPILNHLAKKPELKANVSRFITTFKIEENSF